MTEKPLVSILMPAFNAEKFIAEAIRSILDQDLPNWELLILNDASTDSTLNIINTFNDDRIRIFEQDENQGYLLSCNKLFEKVQGEFITFLDADDSCATNRISTCIAAFDEHLQLDFLTTDHIRTNGSGKLLSEHKVWVDYERYASDPNYYPTICCATIFLRKQLLRQIGGYNPFFKEIGGEDYHWLFLLSRAGKGIHVKESLYLYRTHAHQTHLLNTDPLKYFMQDIDQSMRTEIICGRLPLSDSEAFRAKWNDRIKTESAELHLRRAAEALNSRDFTAFFTQLFLGSFSWPLNLKNVKKGTYLSYSFLARIA